MDKAITTRRRPNITTEIAEDEPINYGFFQPATGMPPSISASVFSNPMMDLGMLLFCSSPYV